MLTFAVSLETSVAVASDICNGRFKTSMVVASDKYGGRFAEAVAASDRCDDRFKRVCWSLQTSVEVACTSVLVALHKCEGRFHKTVVDASHKFG